MYGGLGWPQRSDRQSEPLVALTAQAIRSEETSPTQGQSRERTFLLLGAIFSSYKNSLFKPPMTCVMVLGQPGESVV